MTDLLRRFGVRPDAAIGYSMGESAALVALGAWNDRDEMTRRLVDSPLFATELAGPCQAARRAWGLEPGEPVDWIAGIVPRSAAAVRGGDPRSAPRLRTDHEFGRGNRDRRPAFRRANGRERAGLRVPRAADREHGPLRDRPRRRGRNTASSTTCPRPRRKASPSTAASGAGPIRPIARAAAEAITAQATGPDRLPGRGGTGLRRRCPGLPRDGSGRLVHPADRPDPGRSASPGHARRACPTAMPCRRCWRCWATWSPSGSRLTSSRFIARSRTAPNLERARGRAARPDPRREIRIEPGLPPLELPPLPEPRRSMPIEPEPSRGRQDDMPPPRPALFPLELPPSLSPESVSTMMPVADSPLAERLFSGEHARADAHEAFLRVSQGYAELMSKNLEFQLGLIEATGSVDREGETAAEVELQLGSQRPSIASRTGPSARDRARSRAMPGVRRRLDRRGAGAGVRRDRRPSDAGAAARRAAHAGGPDRDDRGRAAVADVTGGSSPSTTSCPAAGISTPARSRRASPSSRARPTCSSRATSGIDFVTQGAGGLPAARRDRHVPSRPARARRGDPLRHPDHAVLPPGRDAPVPVRVRRDRRRRAAAHHARRLRGVLLGRGAGGRQGHRAPAARRAGRRRASGRDDWTDLVPVAASYARRGAGRGPAPGRPGRRVRTAVRTARAGRPAPPCPAAG